MADTEKAEIQSAPGKTSVFLAWSGENSKRVAKVLRKYLPLLVNAIDPYMSEEDIEKGKKWTPELASNLDSSSCGIICITPENTQSQWLHYEAGALSKTVANADTYVCPFLMGMKEPEYNGPLKMFQATTFSKGEFYKLIKTMNSACGKLGLNEPLLQEAFNNYWEKIEEQLSAILENIKKPVSTSVESESKVKDVGDNNMKVMIEELVVNARSQSRQLSKIENEIGGKRVHEKPESNLTRHLRIENLKEIIYRHLKRNAIICSEAYNDYNSIHFKIEKAPKSYSGEFIRDIINAGDSLGFGPVSVEYHSKGIKVNLNE